MWILGKHRHLSDEQLSEYVSGRLSDGERSRLQRGLDSCDYCRNELLKWQATVAGLRDLPEPELPRSFVMLEAPAPAPLKGRELGFNPLAGLGRWPTFSPWAYAGAAFLVALAGALIITTQGGLPWSGAGEGIMSDASTEQAAIAVAPQLESEAEAAQASQPQIVPAPPAAAALPAGHVERADETVSAMAARSTLTREAASRKAQGSPQDMGKESAPLTQMTEPEPEASSEAAAAALPEATVAPQLVMADIAPASVPASAEADEITSGESPAAEGAAASESSSVESQVQARAQANEVAPAAAASAAEAAPAPRQASGYALDAAEAPTQRPPSRESAATAVPEKASAPGDLEVTRATGTTPAPGQGRETAQSTAGEAENSLEGTPAGEGQDSSFADTGAPVALRQAETPASEQEGIEAEGDRLVDQVSPTSEPAGEEQTAEEITPTEGAPSETELKPGDGESEVKSPAGAAPPSTAPPLFTPDAANKLAVYPQDDMANRAEERRRAAATSLGAGEVDGQVESHPAQPSQVDGPVFPFLWVMGGLLTLVVLVLGGYLAYRVNRSRKSFG